MNTSTNKIIKEPMTDLTYSQLEEILQGRIGSRIAIHNCSMCGYRCGFIVHSIDNIWYDSGCYCTGCGGGYQASVQDILNHHNIQTTPEARAIVLQKISGDKP